MHTDVNEIFPSFSKKFEGRVSWMYLDIKGLVTVGVGNLIDPVEQALRLPFVHKVDGSVATQAQIRDEWSNLKRQQELAKRGHRACEDITDLRLTEEGIDTVVRERLATNEAHLKKTFTEWDSWPADAQLGVLSMAWAMGSGFTPKWPKFTGACKEQNWTNAAKNCKMREENNPGLVPRNQANLHLFTNAASVVERGLDPTLLYYPRVAAEVEPDTEVDPGLNA